VGIFWGAGFETTAHTICWTLFLLATHPEAEAKLLKELQGLGLAASPSNPKPRAMVWENLGSLNYLSAVINESMRMYPVVSSGTIRITHEWTQIGEHLVPPGMPIWVPFYAIHRSARLWLEPDRFLPERWLEGAVKPMASATTMAEPTKVADTGRAGATTTTTAAVAGGDEYSTTGRNTAVASGGTSGSSSGGGNSDNGDDLAMERDQDLDHNTFSGVGMISASTSRAFLPFSDGPRNCIGQSLALVELKAVLAMLMGNFSFELTPEMGGFKGVDSDARQAVTLRPEHGLMMYARHRSLPA
jgi:cytochrome P450